MILDDRIWDQRVLMKCFLHSEENLFRFPALCITIEENIGIPSNWIQNSTLIKKTTKSCD